MDMLQSKYGIFCLKRLLKYGNSTTRSSIISKMYGNAVKLSSHVVSAPVFEYAVTTWASPQQKQHLTQEFFGDLYKKSKDNEIKSLKDIFVQTPDLKLAALTATKTNLLRILNKNLLDSTLVHSVLSQYLQECTAEDRAELISLVVPHIVVISNSRDGTKAAMQCIWHGSNKDRKSILKNVKEHALELSKHEHGHRTIITLFDAIDDTVLLNKMIVNEILKGIKELAESEWGRKVLMWLVAPTDTTCFHKLFIKELDDGRAVSNCKKDPVIRRKEILSHVNEALLEAISEDGNFWLKNSSLGYELAAILKAGEGPGLKKAFDAISAVLVDSEWKTKLKDTEVLGIEDGGIHMILKKIAKNDPNIEDESLRFGTSLLAVLTEEIVEQWLVLNRGCFLLLGVFENSSELIQNKMKELLLSKIKLLKKQSTAGSKILLKKVSE